MTQKTKKLFAVFDIDGTLLDSMPKMHADIIGAFSRLGYKITPEQITAQKGWYDLSSKLGVKKEDYDREFDKRKSWEESLRDGEAPLFRDTLPCLEKLAQQGVTLATLTRSLPEYTKAKLDFHDLNKYFGDRIAVTSPSKAKSKTNDAIELVKKINPAFLQSAYFIGDRAEDVTVAHDVEDAYQLTSSGIYVNRNGSSVPPEMSQYHIVRSLDEIPAIIGEYNGR